MRDEHRGRSQDIELGNGSVHLEPFGVRGSWVGLAAEATVCAQLPQTVARGDHLILKDRLWNWSEELRRR
ncbi:hypothetical protein [Streptomyces sp. MA15]|uniref:hypothetical protein n=1 Tax=Streptomyces sp. MA15 TaxID=3055061 RepID=UPI0025AF58F3|nr:hypothetical protein [Streptomyces sp. MA15]MDN3271193.1 hypothetical protein [Streptomyces sp. MA15]